MTVRPILFLVVSLYSSFILNVADRSVESRRFERLYDISRVIFNIPGGQLRSLLHCGALCDRCPSCKAFCYSRSTALCHLSQPNDPIVQEYDVSDSKCYSLPACPMATGYARYGGRCIKGYADRENYTDARAICTQDGGHLYHFKDREWDLQPIVDLIADKGNMNAQLWMGADALETGGLFRWSDSSLLANDSSLWRSGNPTGGSEVVCVLLQTQVADYLLKNFVCDATRKFVCQIDI